MGFFCKWKYLESRHQKHEAGRLGMVSVHYTTGGCSVIRRSWQSMLHSVGVYLAFAGLSGLARFSLIFSQSDIDVPIDVLDFDDWQP